jgi:hypothetical protein
VFGEYPAFEPEEVGFNRNPETLLPLISGRAAKILDPQLTAWGELDGVKVIWLDRDRNNQARSQVKFLRFMGAEGIPDNAWKRLARSYGSDTAKALKIFRDRGITPLRLGFEMLLNNPLQSVGQIESYVGVPMDRGAMADSVLDRDARCQPGMDIELRLLGAL